MQNLSFGGKMCLSAGTRLNGNLNSIRDTLGFKGWESMKSTEVYCYALQSCFLICLILRRILIPLSADFNTGSRNRKGYRKNVGVLVH